MPSARPSSCTVIYSVKSCPVDATCSKRNLWAIEARGISKEDAMLMFKEHLVKTHDITCGDTQQMFCEQLVFDSYTAPVEGDPRKPSPYPHLVKRSAGEASASTKRRKAQAPAEPPAEKLDEATVVPASDAIADAMLEAKECIQTVGAQAKKLAEETRTFADTMRSITILLQAMSGMMFAPEGGGEPTLVD